ncbi:MAG: YihY/virulence factor BrkB family protein [Pleurocapsa sp.]
MVVCTIDKRLTGLAAEMAFNAMLGLFPAIIAILTALGLFEGSRSIESIFNNLAINLADIIPIQVWTLLLGFIQEVKQSESKSWFSLSSITAIWIISGVLNAAINALDSIHQIPPKYRRSYLKTKLIAIFLTICTISFLVVACFLLWIGDVLLQIAVWQSWDELLLVIWKIFTIIVILAIATTTVSSIYQVERNLKQQKQQDLKTGIIVFIIIVSAVLMQLVLSVFSIIQKSIADSQIEQIVSPITIDIWRLLGFPIALGVVAIAFGLIYRFGTSRWPEGTPIMPGAILAAISWAIVSVVFRIYVSQIGLYNKIYGTVGTIIVLMLWLYLSSLVMLLGAQFNVIIAQVADSN